MNAYLLLKMHLAETLMNKGFQPSVYLYEVLFGLYHHCIYLLYKQ